MTKDGASNVSDEDRLLGELRRLVNRVDPVPDEVTAYAKAALGWRRIDAELAELLSDSVLEPDSLAITRGDGAQARRLTFRSGDLEIDLEIQETDSGIVLMGQLAPPARAEIDVQREDRSASVKVEADALGRFRAELAAGGRIRLQIRREPPAPPIETSWIEI